MFNPVVVLLPDVTMCVEFRMALNLFCSMAMRVFQWDPDGGMRPASRVHPIEDVLNVTTAKIDSMIRETGMDEYVLLDTHAYGILKVVAQAIYIAAKKNGETKLAELFDIESPWFLFTRERIPHVSASAPINKSKERESRLFQGFVDAVESMDAADYLKFTNFAESVKLDDVRFVQHVPAKLREKARYTGPYAKRRTRIHHITLMMYFASIHLRLVELAQDDDLSKIAVYTPRLHPAVFVDTLLELISMPASMRHSVVTPTADPTYIALVRAAQRRSIFMRVLTSPITSMPRRHDIPFTVSIRDTDVVLSKVPFHRHHLDVDDRNEVVGSGVNGIVVLACENPITCREVVKITSFWRNEAVSQKFASRLGFAPALLREPFTLKDDRKKTRVVYCMERMPHTLRDLLDRPLYLWDVRMLFDLVKRFEQSRFVHHDMKPDNLVCGEPRDVAEFPTREWKIIDYGCAWYGGSEYDPQDMVPRFGLNMPYKWDIARKKMATNATFYRGGFTGLVFDEAPPRFDACCLLAFIFHETNVAQLNKSMFVNVFKPYVKGYMRLGKDDRTFYYIHKGTPFPLVVMRFAADKVFFEDF